MQDQKSNLSIFNFNYRQRSFLKLALVFFAPVVILILFLEILVLQIPFNYIITSDYFNTEREEIEVIALGSSQTNSAINPEYFDKATICLASASQHHNLDFNILTQTKDRLPNLKYVILELSYSHLELPHNSKNFWKNNIYLKYYNVNAFERNTYFKDKLIYLSNPDIYSKQFVDHYINKIKKTQLNKYGFDTGDFDGLFKQLDYNDEAISLKKININTKPDLAIFKHNTEFLFKMLDYTKEAKLNVVECTMPLYKTYQSDRNSDILKRRDSILKLIVKKYNNVRVFERENDTIHFITSDYKNQNHLNPQGAEKFSKELNTFINEQFQN